MTANSPENEAAFKALVTNHYQLYPGAKLSEATLLAWWGELADLPIEVLPQAFKAARKAHPDFAATAMHVRAIAEEAAARLQVQHAEKRAERLLPPPTQTRPQVLQSFYAVCDRAARELGDHAVTDRDIPTIAGLLVVMSRYLGCNDEVMAELWGRGVANDCKQRGLACSAVVAGIRRLPLQCLQPPTIGMVVDSVFNQTLSGWPANWISSGKSTEQKPMATEGA